MKLRTITTRAAGAGAVTALIAGGLVAATSTAAHAETGTSQYNCSVMGFTLPVIASVTADLPASAWPTHTPVPDLNWPINGSFTVPRGVLDALGPAGVTKVGVASPTFALALGTADVPLANVATAQTDVPATGDLTLPFAAVLHAFDMDTDAGHYDISMPESFVADIATDGLGTLSGVVCTIDPAATAAIAGFDVTKQSSTITKVTGPKSIMKGKVAKYVATVSGSVLTPTGKVIAKEGKKTLATGTLKSGKAAISLKGLKPGKHTITFSYKGDKNTDAALAKVVKKLKVTR